MVFTFLCLICVVLTAEKSTSTFSNISVNQYFGFGVCLGERKLIEFHFDLSFLLIWSCSLLANITGKKSGDFHSCITSKDVSLMKKKKKHMVISF